ncbi:MAG: hypothetical protein ACI9UR_002225 [Bacteroidia bacterium]|jgi:hypothetical protein
MKTITKSLLVASMNQLRKHFSIILPCLILALVSCEKVIEIDLNNAAPQTVVDAVLAAQDDTVSVFLSTSGSYTDASGLGPIAGAAISITDQNGQTASFSETFNGLYLLDNFNLITGNTYSLSITNEGELIEATSELPALVQIDSVYFEENLFGGPEGGGGPGGGGGGGPQLTQYNVHIQFDDPNGISNNYRVVMSEGIARNVSTELVNDDLNDGQLIDVTIFRANVEAGDTISLELWSMDRAGYDFYNTLADIEQSNPFTSSTPYNPITNLSSGLGHFTVHNRDSRTLIVVP